MSAPFAKSEMLTELRTIFLFEGDHLSLGRGSEFAEAFLGFEPEDGSNYCLDDPSKVDLARFTIADSFSRGFDYAYAPANPIQIDESEVQDLIVFMDGVPRIGGTSAGGERHSFMDSTGFCRRVADTVYARWALEIEKLEEYNIRQLALLANMSEGAVRNAISQKDLASFRRGNSTFIRYDNALQWLLGRKGFVPMPMPSLPKDNPEDALLEARTAVEFGALLQVALETRGRTLEQIGDRLGWTKERIERWRTGDVAPVFGEVVMLARFLDVNETALAAVLMQIGMDAPP